MAPMRMLSVVRDLAVLEDVDEALIELHSPPLLTAIEAAAPVRALFEHRLEKTGKLKLRLEEAGKPKLKGMYPRARSAALRSTPQELRELRDQHSRRVLLLRLDHEKDSGEDSARRHERMLSLLFGRGLQDLPLRRRLFGPLAVRLVQALSLDGLSQAMAAGCIEALTRDWCSDLGVLGYARLEAMAGSWLFDAAAGNAGRRTLGTHQRGR